MTRSQLWGSNLQALVEGTTAREWFGRTIDLPGGRRAAELIARSLDVPVRVTMTWWPDVPEFDHEDPPPRSMLRDLEQLDYAGEPGLTRKLRGDVCERRLE